MVKNTIFHILSKKLENLNKPIISEYELFHIFWNIHQELYEKKSYGNYPSRMKFTRTRFMLKKSGIIRQDKDYTRFWRIMSMFDQPADSIVCITDPYCYISHMSAMQKYGLTNRRPEKLFITSPPDEIAKFWNNKIFFEHYGELLVNHNIYIEPIYITHHPDSVRDRQISQTKTILYGNYKKVRGTEERISSIGQLFLEMLSEPEKCGGMYHIIDIWREHALKYLDQILETIDSCSKGIIKVRAGYILDELMKINHPKIKSWENYAQRGGSRVLESGRPYSEPFSEKWMLSVNV